MTHTSSIKVITWRAEAYVIILRTNVCLMVFNIIHVNHYELANQ